MAREDATRLLARMARQPMLGDDEERDLARRADAGDREAASRLITSHLRFVIKIARRYRGLGLSMSDLVQEGTLGLIQAVRRFNPDHGTRLSTYAMWWIRAAMQDHIVHSWSLVRIGTTNAQKALFLRLRRLIGDAEDLSDELLARLAQGFGTTKAEVAALARRVVGGDQSLDRIEGWADRHIADTPTPEQAVAEASEQRFLGELVARALAMLPPRERIVIQKRYLAEARHTFEAIGRELGVSKDRVRQIEARAMGKLRELIAPALAEPRS